MLFDGIFLYQQIVDGIFKPEIIERTTSGVGITTTYGRNSSKMDKYGYFMITVSVL